MLSAEDIKLCEEGKSVVKALLPLRPDPLRRENSLKILEQATSERHLI